ncbi:glyoxysomal fatty acid beta-oxidation multifunctional protein MFP-a-like isoform X2 [Triticum dicoccoides]|uniref:glyoxysomal fatty acid beta-oxidation multifunctional protein MFP-a-like isoform X2 n=1 Tax=Triticum dicoccoides TaxID=85692 RepID=UPI000E7B8C24|nr:glyoxysomal fatty acid beta-oxidation multifunctional protein MFP-a-like isoform X2 [Triticum dicoccoides]
MAKGRTEMEVGSDGVAVIYVANPPVNALSIDVLFSLKGHYEEALRRNDVKAIVLTGSERSFSAGLDISAFADIRKPEQLKDHCILIESMTDIFEDAGKPSVAAIDGPALGGGLELSMVCQARISTPNAQLGLTELQFGVIPGFGGTQRLPRLVGLTKALEMMMLSKPINAEEAHELGLVDAVVSPNDLLNDARRWALDICESKRPWVRALYKTDKLESPEVAREILNSARVLSRKQAANLQHPLVCIDAVEEGIVSGPRAGLRKEAMAFQELFFSDTCKSLIHVFFSQRATSKVPGITDLGLTPRKVSKVAIVGCGLMGSGIATALILSHYPVILKEVNEKSLNAGIDRIKENLLSRVRKGKMTKEKYEKTLSLLTGVLDYEKFKTVDLAIEAVVENVKLKQQIFAELEQHCPSHCILATNTSTIDLNLIGEKTNSQERIVGTHFFAPAHIMPLLEIVRTPRASLQAVVTLLDVGKKIKKTPIVVGNCTGFAVYRMFFPYTQAALLLVDHGMDVYKIDQACTEFGMSIGPFRMTDLVGFGVALATGMQFLENFPELVYKSMLIPLMVEDKRTGEASQKGFYRYEGKRKASPDPEIMNYVNESRRIAGATPDPELLKLDNSAIAEMVFFPVINEACRVLGEGIAFKASDLDIASIFGMGFPPYRGGIMHWADSIGARRICTMLSEWEMKYDQFFKPCSHLLERAGAGLPLSASATMMMNQAKTKILGGC